MSNSSNAVEQREKEEKVVSSFMVLSFVGSAVLHIAVLTLSSLWLKTPKLVEKPIEVILVEPSTPKAVKIKQNTPPKDKPVAVKHTTPKFKTITKSLNISGADVRAIASSLKSGSGTNGTPSTLLSHPDASIPSVKQSPTARKQSQPVKTASSPKSVLALKPKPNLSPLDPIPPLPTPEPTKIPLLPVVARTLPPLPILKPSQTLPPLPTVAQKPPLPTSAPTQKPLLKPKSTPELKSVTTLSSKPTQTETPLPAFTPSSSTATPKLPFPTSPSTAKDNNVDQPENNNSTATHSNIATLGNRNRGGNGTHDSEQSGNSGNGSLPGSGKTRAIATGNRNSRSNSLGSDGLTCLRCPLPKYPSGSEGIEARAVVKIYVRRDGSVRNAEISESSGYDNLDQEVVQTVEKKWKFVSTDSEQQTERAVSFAKPGSEFERRARERERHTHEVEQKRRRERRERVPQNTENPVAPDIIYTPRP